MASAFERRKDPAAVRSALLECAISIAANEGLDAVTVAGVSLAAGVTKGALFHHFANKQALVDAMIDGLIRDLDEIFDLLIAADSVPHGSFTRAYIQGALTMDQATARIWSALIRAMSTETRIAERWQAWLAQRLRQHAATDEADILVIVRLAADGAWFTSLTAVASGEIPDLQAVRARLMAMTF